QVERRRSAHLADDDPFRTHAQAVAHEIAHRDLALALEVRWPCLQSHHVRLLKLQLGGVLAGDDALVVLDEARHAVEQRRLARTGAAGNDHVAAGLADDAEYRRAFRRYRAVLDKLLHRQLVALELADGQRRTIDRQRRHDDVDAAAVGQARVADRTGLVDAAADLADDPLADVEQLRVVAEAD